jgi:6-pyruvoyltetrahydropterin/6-carboxytetrahydropterin synthase
MYQLCIKKDFVARHFLTVPDCGPENIEHSHVYALEILLEASGLDAYGYLVDIDLVKASMQRVLDRFRDHLLNDDPAFEGLNPSIEHFARIVTELMKIDLERTPLDALTVKIWEDDEAWASYGLQFSDA